MKKPVLVDANVILRYLLADDVKQSPEAANLFAQAPTGTLRVSGLTLAEVSWVLLAHYKVPRDQVALALQRVLAQPSVEADNVIEEAVTRFSLSKLDLADCMLAAEAAHSQCEVVTYDQDFRRFQDITALSAKAALAQLLGR
jgi:predicted nucleic-acid-binding protein